MTASEAVIRKMLVDISLSRAVLLALHGVCSNSKTAETASSRPASSLLVLPQPLEMSVSEGPQQDEGRSL